MSSASNSTSPQYSRQLEVLSALYRSIPSNVWSDEVEKALTQILDSLQTTEIPDQLVASYNSEQLEAWLNEAQEQYEKMGAINHERMKSLVELSDIDLHQSIFETLFLFDLESGPPLEIRERDGFDEEGKPIYKVSQYPVLQEKALSGVEGLERFLPQMLKQGYAVTDTPGMSQYLNTEYPDLAGNLKQNANTSIRAITTIGSLGGIGHKPDSDMDAQVIFDTNPQFDHAWNDADFFIALLSQIFQSVYHATLQEALDESTRNTIQREIEEAMRKEYGETLSEDERHIVRSLFPSNFKTRLEAELIKAFQKLPSAQQARLLWNQISKVLNQYPYFEKYLSQLTKFFSFIKVESQEKVLANWFPFSLKKLNREQMLRWLAEFYWERYVDDSDFRRILKHHGQQYGLEPKKMNRADQNRALLENLRNLNQRGPVVKGFLIHLMGKLAIFYQSRLPEVVSLLRTQFDPRKQFLQDDFLVGLSEPLKENFRAQMIGLVDAYSEHDAIRLESEKEYAVHSKIRFAEAYIAHKYPDTEVHYFSNILRKQRVGHHTSFLVSSEGSMAYDVMLNDFLLNPAVVLAGSMPIPFNLPHEVKTLCNIGALPEAEWTLSQTIEENAEQFTIRELADWGDNRISRKKFLGHAIPIFLRESEKVSHRNLPKALLNCWWVEMLCQEPADQTLTSLTQLLWNPQKRHFLVKAIEHSWVGAIESMETEYPQLVRDPWWLKFTEMLLRFEDPEIQKSMIFCFAQHLRISDIIDYNNRGNPIRLDESATWRIRALVSFYNFFIPDENERKELMKFSQGRDDVCNRMEKTLKIQFLHAMRRTEQKLIDEGNHHSLKLLMGYVLKLGGNQIGPKAKTVAAFTLHLLDELNQQLIITDQKVIHKALEGKELNRVEKQQLEGYQADRLRVQTTVNQLMDYYENWGMAPDSEHIEKLILDSRMNLHGDPLENVIFKYHFERNFKRKPFQIPTPISKSLSVPRKRIMLNFNNRTQRWVFKSVLSKQELAGVSRRLAKKESEIDMFEDHLVQGLARCVFSGYLGFSTTNLTSFEKPAGRITGTAASNPVNHQELQFLAAELREFFPPISVSPRELLEDIHYIREIFMACNVNRFNTISLVVRDNFGDCFVVDFDVDRIKVKLKPSDMKFDPAFSRFFMQFNSRECRYMFMKTLGQLNIPLDMSHRPHFKIWINTGNFNLPIAPKFYRIYLEGVAHALWPLESMGTAVFLHPARLNHGLDFFGKRAIQNRQVS